MTDKNLGKFTIGQEMNYNIYFSPTGGTKKVADILVSNLGGEVCEVDICPKHARDLDPVFMQAAAIG